MNQPVPGRNTTASSANTTAGRDTASQAPRETIQNPGFVNRAGLREGQPFGEDGRYRILRELGHGGMGAVYLAKDSALGDRKVAIKIPFLAGESAEIQARFRREAALMATIQHPNLGCVYDVRDFEGRLYSVNEYISGMTLADYLASGKPLAVPKRVWIVRKVAQALHAAHEKGVIHRDVKPQNIMLNRDGQPKLIDFGLALNLASDETRATQNGMSMGTPEYMPLEQIVGDLEKIGPLSDVYSLGVVLYELLTGTVPFTGANPLAVGVKLVNELPPSPLAHNAALDPRLADIVLKAIAKQPEDRYASMDDFARALKRFARQEADSTHDAEPGTASIGDVSMVVFDEGESGSSPPVAQIDVAQIDVAPASVASPVVDFNGAPIVTPVSESSVRRSRRRQPNVVVWAGIGLVGLLGLFVALRSDTEEPPTENTTSAVPTVATQAPLQTQPLVADSTGAAESSASSAIAADEAPSEVVEAIVAMAATDPVASSEVEQPVVATETPAEPERSPAEIVEELLTEIEAIASPSDPVRSPVPTEADQQASRTRAEETYKFNAATTPSRKRDLLVKLTEAIANPELESADLYVLTTTAIALAEETSHLPHLKTSLDRLVSVFDVDTYAERSRHLLLWLERLKAGTPATPAVREIAALSEEMAGAGQHRAGLLFLDQAEAAATKAGMSAAELKPLHEARKRLDALWEQRGSLEAARAVLEKNPDDPSACFAAAQFLVEAGDWTQALPLLTKATEKPDWQAAAQLEQQSESKPLGVANTWWTVGDSVVNAELRRAVHLHSATWYRRSLPQMSEVDLLSLEPCLVELVATISEAGQPNSGEDSRPTALVGDWELIEPKGPVELLPRVVLPDHVLQGTWRRIDGSLACEPSIDPMFMVPVAIDGGYHLDVEFSRHSGNYVYVCFPVAGSSCAISLGLNREELHCLWYVNRRNPVSQPAGSGTVFRPGRLTNNHRYQLHVDVKVMGSLAQVTAELDGVRIIVWKGNPYDLLIPFYYARPVAQSISMGAHDGSVDFHSVKLRLDRRAEAYFLDENFRCPLTIPADIPPKEWIDKCAQWNGKYYMPSDRPMSFVEAQRMAVTLKGRLLTIGSREEEDLFFERGRGLIFWTSAWRRTDSTQWRDERNAPLRFMGNWASQNPGYSLQERFLAIQTDSTVNRGWHDCPAWNGGIYSCVEWGEENPLVQK